ncbi:hypothetical protein A9Q99_12575 [Gammaproteobacteria bacterium 45_16_T64]|nr:hypothetical protein A9Q99_12575 [Gammaproteobacteria bacterium 45_16_T64]
MNRFDISWAKSCAKVLGFCIVFTLSGCWEKPDNTRYITDAQGRSLILHGINSSSSAKNPATGHMPWVSEADVEQEVVEWGFNFVRFLIFWDGVEPERGLFDEGYLDAVEERVNWYTSRGAYVMLDMHQDIYGHAVGGNGAPEWATELSLMDDFSLTFPEGLPWWIAYVDPTVIAAFLNFWGYNSHQYLQDHYIQSWQKVAERFRDHPGVIGYDLMNEPYPGDLVSAVSLTFEPTRLKAFYDRLIPALRSVDNDKWIFYEPQSLGINFGLPSMLPPLSDGRIGEKRLVYAPHAYPFTLHEGVAYNLTDKLNMVEWNKNRVNELNQHQVPLLVGEFGGSDETPGFREYLDDTLTMFDTMGASWAYWSNDPGGWGLLDAQGNETPKVAHLVRPYPRAIAGEPDYFTFDVVTKVFELQFFEKVGVEGGTDIHLPQRHYPNGWEIEHSDEDGQWRYEWDESRQIVTIFSDPMTSVHKIRIYSLK